MKRLFQVHIFLTVLLLQGCFMGYAENGGLEHMIEIIIGLIAVGAITIPMGVGIFIIIAAILMA